MFSNALVASVPSASRTWESLGGNKNAPVEASPKQKFSEVVQAGKLGKIAAVKHEGHQEDRAVQPKLELTAHALVASASFLLYPDSTPAGALTGGKDARSWGKIGPGKTGTDTPKVFPGRGWEHWNWSRGRGGAAT